LEVPSALPIRDAYIFPHFGRHAFFCLVNHNVSIDASVWWVGVEASTTTSFSFMSFVAKTAKPSVLSSSASFDPRSQRTGGRKGVIRLCEGMALVVCSEKARGKTGGFEF
jgi:hypothetical protein